MLRPIQRLPQYKLLLEKYVHNLADDPLHPDREDALQALKIVSDAAEHTNERLRMNESYAKLLAIQQCLRGSYELLRPHRKLLKKEMLQKISRKGTQQRLFLLCSDCLIYLSVLSDQLYRVHHELPLAGMRVEQPPHEFITEIHIHSRTRSIRVLLESAEKRQEWADAIRDAIAKNRQRRASLASASQRSSNGTRRIRFQSLSGSDSPSNHNSIVKLSDDSTPLSIEPISLTEDNMNDSGVSSITGTTLLGSTVGTLTPDGETPPLGSEAPIWVPDSRVTMCQLCTCEFTLTVRRHHCRACGQVVCSRCSSFRIELPYMRRKQRVCDSCYEQLQADANDKSTPTTTTTAVLLRSNLTNQLSANELTITSIASSGLSSCNSLDSMGTIGNEMADSHQSLPIRSESFEAMDRQRKNDSTASSDQLKVQSHDDAENDSGSARRRSIGAIQTSDLFDQRRSSGNSVFFTGWSLQDELADLTNSDDGPSAKDGCSIQRSRSHAAADPLPDHLIRLSVRTSGRKRSRVPKRLCEVSANDPSSAMAGYLWKRVGKRSWKRFWFVLKEKVLYTYRESEDVLALQTLPLLGYEVQSLQSSVDGHPVELCIQIKHANQPIILLRLEHSAFYDK